MNEKLAQRILIVIDSNKESEINSRTIKILGYSDRHIAECVEDLVDEKYVMSRNITTHDSDLIDGKWFKEYMISRITGKGRDYIKGISFDEVVLGALPPDVKNT